MLLAPWLSVLTERSTLRALAVATAVSLPAPAVAYFDMYPPTEIARDAKRLETAVRRIYRIGILPKLTARERAAFDAVRFAFPKPKRDDRSLNFYATWQGGVPTVVMPVLSLKQLEDLTTAYAWLQIKRYSHSTIDLYFAMLSHKLVIDFPGSRYPDILTGLGIPKDALKDKRIDRLSLSLRNEVIAFILLHELGHLLYRHKGYADITKRQAREDELQSDRFALDVLVRTNTPPLGAVLFFQAQAFAMPHRGQFATENEWRTYLNRAATHPLSTERIALMADTFEGPFARRRPSEALTWRSVGSSLRAMKRILENVDQQRCVVATAKAATLADLKPTRKSVGLKSCDQG
ncbi:MAG: hypothetical protein AAFZ05_03895 [Pseudomonadota bacterium]